MNPATPKDTLEPSDLAFLQHFFNETCAERGLEGGSLAAANLAAQLILLYQRGVRDEKDLQIHLEEPSARWA